MAHIPDMCPKCGKYHHDELAHRDTEPSTKIDILVKEADRTKDPEEKIDTLPMLSEVK